MYITKTQIKKEIKDELNCTTQFINHISKCGFIDQIKEALSKDDSRTRLDIMDEIYDEYRTYPYKSNEVSTSATADDMILAQDENAVLYDLSELIDGEDDPLLALIMGDDDGE